MTEEELLEKLREANKIEDTEERHTKLDSILLEFIDNKEVTEEYNKHPKWYA